MQTLEKAFQTLKSCAAADGFELEFTRHKLTWIFMTPGRCFFVKALLYFPDESFMKQYQKLNFVNQIKFFVKLPDDKN